MGPVSAEDVELEMETSSEFILIMKLVGLGFRRSTETIWSVLEQRIPCQLQQSRPFHEDSRFEAVRFSEVYMKLSLVGFNSTELIETLA
ncbi:hypothetical protein GH714_025417 [Hevea brasiliensis]|uniref:Uncharacterized protein n=1 Tax=Hevea brasiliensis TaxID=3981 RepID=A0A6A6MMV9_HEVBR|nr:hypothetical protein GH714_025417 [Hevea brasiliensis]